MMNNEVYAADDVATYFLSLTDPEGNDVSNLKLQKLCYYAQGIGSAVLGHPVFNEKLEAWDHGPVVPDLYHRYKSYGSNPIPTVSGFDYERFSPICRRILTDVYEYYGQFSAWRLRNMTHDDKPWADAYKSGRRLITVDSLIAHFRPIIEDDYINDVFGRNGQEAVA